MQLQALRGEFVSYLVLFKSSIANSFLHDLHVEVMLVILSSRLLKELVVIVSG